MGVKTLYEYFYKLAYGDKGTVEHTKYVDNLDVADAEIKANKDAKHNHSNKTLLDTYTQTEADLADAVSKKHSRNTDTHLGTVDANINMNTHKLTSLAVPSANGDSVRATTKITEVNLESAIDHKDLTDDPHSVTKIQVGLSNIENLKVKLDATSAPTVNNDVDEGYAVGSRWFDITNDKEYVCLDNTDGTAVWTETTGGGGGGLANIVEDTTPQLGGHLDTNDFGISFPATQVPDAGANVLDDYEEGTWTPALKFDGNSVDMTYTAQAGLYTKIGRMVVVNCYIYLSAKGISTGNATIIGLPFTNKNVSGAETPVSLLLSDITFANRPQGHIGKNVTAIIMSEVTEAGSFTQLNNTNFTNSSEIMLSATYFTD